MKTPLEIVQLMLEKDAFSNWLGIEVEHISEGKCILKCTVTAEMLNGFGIAHGGISYSLADSALAFASNSRGLQSVSIETSISHIKPVSLGDILIANCSEIQSGKNIGRYETTITNQSTICVAKFYGTVFRTEKEW